MSAYLLIHGAYQGGWIWKLVAARLAKAGHSVLTPTLEGCGHRSDQLKAGISTETHADELARMLHYYDLNDIVVVGTSSGGMVMARLAESVPERISRLVFADALMLMNGEKIRDIVTQPAAINTDLALGPSKEDAASRLLAGLPEDLKTWAADRFTLHPEAVFHRPVELAQFWDMPWKASVLYCTQAANPGERHLRRGAEKLGAKWHEIATGHYPMLSTPDELVRIILDE